MPDPALQEAIALAKQGQRKEAQALTAQYLKANPKDVNGWVAMARLVDDPVRALQCWQRASDLRPGDQRIKDEIAKLDSARSLDPLADIPIAPAPKLDIAPKPRRRWLRTAGIIIGALLLICVAVVFVGPRVSAAIYPCGRFGIIETLEPLDTLREKFHDQADVASTTPRISLSGPLSDLQETHREAENLVVPPCAELAHRALLLYMEAEVESLLAFMGQADDDQVTELMILAVEADKQYLEIKRDLLIAAGG